MAINPTVMPPKTEAPAPEIAPETITGMKQYPFLKEQQAAGEKAVETKIKADALKESTALEEKGKALEKIGAEDKAYYEDVKGKMEKPPEFKPTQENAMELGAIFSLIGTMGVSLGGSGKLSGLNALNAMGGMLKGWQQGKKDVFAKEQAIFDKEVARIKSANDMLLKDLEQYQKLRISDKEAALVQAQQIASKNPGVIAALLESGKANVAYEIAKKNSDIHAEIMKLASKNSVGGKTSSTLLAGRAENIREAFAQAAKDIVNITKFPEGTMLGTFSGLTGADANSMVSGIRNGVARGVTEKEQRMLETLLSGIEGHMAFALGGGYASSQSKARMDQYKAQLARSGDDPVQVPLMLARFRQEMNILAENFSSKPGASPEMNDAVQRYNQMINDAVPFTVENVLDAEFGTTPQPKTNAGPKPTPTQADRDRAKSSPESRQRFITHFGVEP